MIEDFRLRVFMTVAQEKSFTKAASLLEISQPAVSQHISELERTCGVKLFERLHGEVRLTPQGSLFSQHASRILDAYESASALFSPMQQTEVTIKASEEVYLYIYSALELFHNIHPEVIFMRTADEHCDLSFALRPAPKTMGGISATHNVISTMYLLCSPSENFAETELFEILRVFLADTIS